MTSSSAGMEQLYQQVILDAARARHGSGLVDATGAGARVAESHQVNTTCGDEVTLRVEIGESDVPGSAAPVITRVSWDGQGCSISQASLSVLTDMVTGMTVADADQLGETFRALMSSRGKGLDETYDDALGDAAAFTGVSQFPARIKCALLGWAALRDASARAAVQ